MNRRIFGLILCVLALAACSGGKEQKPDPMVVTRSQAAELSDHALDAYKKGDYELALNYYREALRLSSSVEDFDFMAIGAINTASALRATGKLDEADILVDAILRSTYMQLSDGMKAEARYLKALILLDMKDAAGAMHQAGLALKACHEDCNALARIYNLLARASLVSGDNTNARSQAEAGLKASHAHGDKREAANSLRLMGKLDEAEGGFDKASEHYEQALKTDKGLALGPKIYLDLMGLGRVSVKLGDHAKANEYYSRALSVAEALGDSDKTALARDALAGVQKKPMESGH